MHPTADFIKTQAYNYSGKNINRWKPEKERYMEFTVSRGITKYEDSDLNMSPEGKMRR